MRALVLLPLLLAGCKVSAPDLTNEQSEQIATLAGFKQCRDINTGRFAKCQTCPDGSRIAVSDECPIVQPEPVPEPTPDPVPPSPPTDPLIGEAPIASNFDVNAQLISIPLAGSAGIDPVGAFRFICNPGQLLRDDPRSLGVSEMFAFYANYSRPARLPPECC